MTATPPRPEPPPLSRWLLRVVLHPTDRDCALSDLAEEFDRRAADASTRSARRWYRRQAMTSVWPAMTRRWASRTLTTTSAPRPQLRGAVLSELRWAWRGVRARGWRAIFVVALLAVALAANAIVFAAADAFVFRPVPYLNPSRLVIVEKVDPTRGPIDYIWPPAVRAWRTHRDIFADVQAHIDGASVYLTTEGITESVRAGSITPGLLELLGVMPKWGRPFTNIDVAPGAPPAAIIGESLARRLFGDPAAATGRTFSTGSATLTIVGVMPGSFRFPTAREEIWRPLDLSKWPDNYGVRDIARLAPGQTLETAARAVADRSAAVEQATAPPSSRPRNESMRLRSMADVRSNPRARTVFGMLVAAAACLLLIACANIASLEMAAANARGRVQAIQTALGASRASLLRSALLEGTLLLGASAVLASLLTTWGLGVLDRQLTTTMRDALTNPLDVDTRVVGFTLGVAAVTWLLTSLPALWRTSRLSVVDGLRDDPRTMPVTRAAARSRQLLMAAQVALTTVLLVGSVLYLRTFLTEIGLDTGFDSTHIATIEVYPADDAPRKGADLESAILDRVRTLPGVRSVARTDGFPPSTQSGIVGSLTIEGRDPTPERVMIHFVSVDPEYFQTTAIPIVQGHAFDASTPPDQVVVDERLARKYWPAASALGARFNMGKVSISGISNFQIAGVSRELRADRLTTAVGEDVFVAYIRPSPTYHPLLFVARLDDDNRLADITTSVRNLATRSIVRVSTVSERYARLAADARLAAATTSGFGVIGFLVATSGVYAVMAFLVAGRSKEIAIRMALGADGRSVRRLVLSSSLRFVGAGLVAGLVASAIGSRWIAAQLSGVTPTDPTTYLAVAALVVGTAVAATWWPARRASRVDPALTLRAQ